MTTEVAIVGGGPAGSVTAMLLARAGFAVTLVERQEFPRAKACGDCLSPAANQILMRIGVWDTLLRAGPAFLEGWQLTAPRGATFRAQFADVSSDPRARFALALRRDIFDHVLLEQARAAGAHVLRAHVTDLLRAPDGTITGVRVRMEQGTFALRARLVIGADGLRSVVARRLQAHHRRPRLRKASFTAHLSLAGTAQHGEMRVARHACLGIAPVQTADSARTHNLTLVLKHGSFDPRGGPRAVMRAGLRKFGIEADLEGTRVLGSGPFDWPVRRVTFDGAALVGDAAGYYDPFTGEGIYQAIAGAELLAEHAARALQTQRVDRRALQPYAEAQQRLVQPARRVQRLIEFVCAHPRLADVAFARIATRPEIARALIGITGDLQPPHTLFSPHLLTRLVT